MHEHLVTLDEREKLALARLNTLLDRPIGSPVGQLAEPREDSTLPALATLQRLAIDHQPSLVAARLAIEHTEARVAAERQEHEPDFFVKGGYMLMPGRDHLAVRARADHRRADRRQQVDRGDRGIVFPAGVWGRSSRDTQNRRGGAMRVQRAVVVGVGLMLATATTQARAQVQAGETPAGIAYEASGVGPPVVLIHGFSLDRRMWEAQAGTHGGGYDALVSTPAEAGTNTQSAYVIVAGADAHYAAAKAAGAEMVLDIEGQAYGGRGYTCRDIEGYMWSFGDYDPWAH